MADELNAAVRAFDGAARIYEQVRPSYPREVIDRLTEAFRLDDNSLVLDLAAGTGKLTRLLVSAGLTVVAVEPIAGMRDELTKALPDVMPLDGTAEAIPLDGESVDVVAAAQAFHWFDADRALPEIDRVLRPGGGLALVWNVRDESVPWVKAYSDRIVELAGGRPYETYNVTSVAGAMTTGAHRTVTDFGFEPVGAFEFANPIEASVDDVVARAASTSFVAALEAGRRQSLLDDVRHLLLAHPDLVGQERFEFPHDTEVYLWRKH